MIHGLRYRLRLLYWHAYLKPIWWTRCFVLHPVRMYFWRRRRGVVPVPTNLAMGDD